MKDFKRGQCGFTVSFHDTPESTAFTWKDVLARPTATMFFGAPLSVCRSFDEALKNITNLHSLHHRFVAYYDHFEGDVVACLSLLNTYMSRRYDILSAKSREWKKKAELLDGDVLRSPAAVKFLTRFDDLCKGKIESALCCFGFIVRNCFVPQGFPKVTASQKFNGPLVHDRQGIFLIFFVANITLRSTRLVSLVILTR